MKTVAVDSNKCTLRRVLQEAKDGDVVFLTVAGDTRYVLAAVDDSDREVCSLRSNPHFMAHLSELEKRARSRPRRSLRDVRARFAHASTSRRHATVPGNSNAAAKAGRG